MIRLFFLSFSFAFLLGCDSTSNIKNPSLSYFIKYFGDEGNQKAKDLIVNADGTFYILGNSTEKSGAITKVYVAHVDALGNVIKQITYGSFPMDARDFEIWGGDLVIVANRQPSGNDVLLSRYSLGLKPIDSVALQVGSNTFANSVTGLNDGGFIVEGYRATMVNATADTAEIHMRVDNQLNPISGNNLWSPNFYQPTNSTINQGIKVVQYSDSLFYEFGFTDAAFQGVHDRKFFGYVIGYNGLPGGAVADLPTFGEPGSRSDKILTTALKAGRGGYLLVGYSSGATDSLKVAITTPYQQPLYFDFKKSGVDNDALLVDLGKGHTPFVTAYSSASYNFLLANTYKNPQNSNSDILLLKVDNNLVNQWGLVPVQFGGSGEDTAAAVAELPDGHIMVLGTMQLGNPPEQFKIVLMKLNANGQLSD